MTFSIAGRFIGREHPPYLIAEIGTHHNNDPVLARELIAAAASAGADAVKFQAYRADWLVTKDAPPYWRLADWAAGKSSGSQWEAFKATEAMPIEQYYFLADYAKEQGVDFLMTAFDEWLVDELDPLVPAWKIASGDITHEALLRHIASKGKPIILSTGASTLREVNHARFTIREVADVPLALLHCVLAYPTLAAQANLLAISTMALYFSHDAIFGWSDHVIDRDVIPVAYTLGARIFEKHFTLNREQPGGDHYHSWTPTTLTQTKAELEVLRAMLGSGEKIVLQCETPARRGARRCIRLIDGQPRMLRPGF